MGGEMVLQESCVRYASDEAADKSWVFKQTLGEPVWS